VLSIKKYLLDYSCEKNNYDISITPRAVPKAQQGVALSKQNGTVAWDDGPEKGKRLQTFRIYYKHSGFMTNIPDLLDNITNHDKPLPICQFT
jgi:hypothetical protein